MDREGHQTHVSLMIKALDGFHQTYVSLLNQVAQWKPITRKAPRNRHHIAKVRENQLTRRIEITFVVKPLRKRLFVLHREDGRAVYLAQVPRKALARAKICKHR